MNAQRNDCINRAKNEVQDCLIIGAGINGAVSAAALAGRGAKVTVVDKGDFASLTSQESSNLAWGGIKYLENYEFSLVWGLCKSRNNLMDSFPKQVQEIRFFTSIAKGFRKPRFLVYLGALLYWFMGRCRTRPPRLLSLATIRKEAPMVNTDELIGGLEYSDCYFVNNDTRFAFSFIRRVLAAGSHAINYLELLSADWENGLWDCHFLDYTTHETVRIRSKSLINAAGPFADRINDMLCIESSFKHIFSKGAHIIVPRITKTRHVLTFFASDGRLFFMIPMGNRTCIGTTDTQIDHETAEPTDDDVEFLLENANRLLSLKKPLTKTDIIAQRCGVRPLVIRKEAQIDHADWTALSRRHEIDIHPERNMCSIYGGKLTDCINVGEEVSDIIRSFGLSLTEPLECWYGKPMASKRARFKTEAKKCGLPDKQTALLWQRYEHDAFKCLHKIRDDSSMKEIIIGDYIRAELYFIAEHEMVIYLDDFLRRRSLLAQTTPRATLHCDPNLPEISRILLG